MEYPKIETLYDRNETTHKVIVGQLRCPEFALVKEWRVTEKIHGMNTRVTYDPLIPPYVRYSGRTDDAQIPARLVDYLRAVFTPEALSEAFPDITDPVILYGEGYGAKINSGGGYRADIAFRLFDVYIKPWWLEPHNIADVARKLGIKTVPFITTIPRFPESQDELRFILRDNGRSIAAQEDGGPGCFAEGIVARSVPLLFNRKGERLMWKLKLKDFPEKGA